jgi:hypothetical protein
VIQEQRKRAEAEQKLKESEHNCSLLQSRVELLLSEVEKYHHAQKDSKSHPQPAGSESAQQPSSWLKKGWGSWINKGAQDGAPATGLVSTAPTVKTGNDETVGVDQHHDHHHHHREQGNNDAMESLRRELSAMSRSNEMLNARLKERDEEFAW